MSPHLVTFFLSRWAKTPHLLRCDPRLGDIWLNAFKRNKCNNYNLVTKEVGYCFHITFHHSSPRSVCCCFIIPRWTGRSCALPVPRPALRPVACCPSQLSRPPLSRSGAALTSSSSSFWGFTPGRADHWTHGGGSEDYCHASERAWSSPSWRRRVSDLWRNTSGKGTEKSRVLGGNMNSVAERCQLRTGMLWASGTNHRKGEEMMTFSLGSFHWIITHSRQAIFFLNNWR